MGNERVRAGLLAEILEQIQKGEKTEEELVAFKQGRNPFALERNRHGHAILSFIGTSLSGSQEISALEALGVVLSEEAKSCFKSTRADGYDLNHLAVTDKPYTIVLVSGAEIASEEKRTSEALCLHVAEKYGYGVSRASFVPPVRKRLSNSLMEELGIWYAVALHKPILSAAKEPSVLAADRYTGLPFLSAYAVNPGKTWNAEGVFIFQDLGT